MKTKKYQQLAILLLLGLRAFAQQQDSVTASARLVEQKVLLVKEDSLAKQEIVLPQAAKDTTSLSFKDTDIRDIFRALSYRHGLNIFWISFPNSVWEGTVKKLCFADDKAEDIGRDDAHPQQNLQ